jgi:hypothetical protein
MLRLVALVTTDVPKERIAYIIRVARIGDLAKLTITSNRSTLLRNNVVPSSPICHSGDRGDTFSETSVLTRAARRSIPEDEFFRVTAVRTSNLT